MKLKEVCVLDVACCTRDMSIVAAARLMREKHTGDLVVVDDRDEDREPVGMITDRDIVVEVLAKGLDPSKTTVGDVMSKHVVLASASEDVADALQRMAVHGVRRVPVVDDEQCVVGIVSFDDLLRQHAEQGMLLWNVLTKEQVHEQRARR